MRMRNDHVLDAHAGSLTLFAMSLRKPAGLSWITCWTRMRTVHVLYGHAQTSRVGCACALAYLICNVTEETSRALLDHMLDAHAHFDIFNQPLEELDEVCAFPRGKKK
jgi:hypothetical protein